MLCGLGVTFQWGRVVNEGVENKCVCNHGGGVFVLASCEL